MSTPPILEPDKKYSFLDYFKLDYDVEEILQHFGYSLSLAKLNLPKADSDRLDISALAHRIETFLPHISLTSEMARREFLIAPLLMDLVSFIPLKVKVGYWVNVSPQLYGAIDYYLQAQNDFLIIEAKDENLQRGFTQLAVELIAMSQWIEGEQRYLYGAISIGTVGQFSRCDRHNQTITQDLNLYRVPNDLSELMGILVKILGSEDG
ncbi:MAG: hypothetical protein ACPGVO_13290 [Spirulinaceae cyanobacterium]